LEKLPVGINSQFIMLLALSRCVLSSVLVPALAKMSECPLFNSSISSYRSLNSQVID
jgi:hypothetical protein